MSMKPLAPEQVRARVRRRWDNQHGAWLDEAGSWPLTIALGAPTERDALAQPGAVRQWVRSWADWSGGGIVQWAARAWPRAGAQRLPVALQFADADEVARLLGEQRRWQRACERRARWLGRWPRLRAVHDPATAPAVEDEGAQTDDAADVADAAASGIKGVVGGLGRYFRELADYDEADFVRLGNVLEWCLANPASGLYIRELPIPGVDTKWLETRKALVLGLLGRIRGEALGADLHAALGLKREPATVRLKVLCAQLREATAGLRELESTVHDLGRLALRPRVVLIVENQTTGWALPDVPGAVAFVRLGNAVGLLAGIGWLRDVPVVYWGDLDTHGLAIAARARRALGQVRSVLMDEATLLAFREFWAREPSQHSAIDFPEWTDAERAVFEALRAHRWGENVRLEQERLPWPLVWPRVEQALVEAAAA